MDDDPPMHYAGFPDEWLDSYPVVWGSDGQTIFFDTEYVNENGIWGYGRRLIEASVITGETLRVVYDYLDPFPVTLSPDLKHLSVGLGGPYYEDNPAYLFDLATDKQLDITDLIPDRTALYRSCWPFSPDGQFITAIVDYHVTRYRPELEPPDDYRDGQGSLILLVDLQGNIQHVVGEPTGSPATTFFMKCPGWQSDGQAFVFEAWDADRRYIMHYSLADRQTTTLYERGFGPGREPYIYSPLIPSPDNTHIALTVSDYYGEDRLVAVLYPDGEIYRIPSPYRFGLYPLWVPPLDAADGAYNMSE